ncbi:DUF5666 domain-containing protein [Erythrobacter sp. SDW2]|uniref:DUF5666 domain-containing protein n=1 Tax=Erythrobacter sp. SDW2 TaxID=2907154 RepID=UPI001F490BFB|nr:DUF5666 domain-containing protein [Erythrobacter sp. SDW2]UIP06394.1 DUF5666 domain-containing protein [Erythrobacter sp. SDW2]
MKQTFRKTIALGAATLAMAASPALPQTPAQTDDGEWLTLSGTVESVSGDVFMLDYGSNSLPVEMDDFDWFNENVVMPGDEVTVTGLMDNDFLQTRRIEASTVYIDKLRTRYFANSADEEGGLDPMMYVGPVDTEGLDITGYVTAITGDEMIVDAGVLEYKVDAGELLYDPFDDDGLTRIDVGDRVSVSGRFDDSDFFDTPEIDAVSIIELSA